MTDTLTASSPADTLMARLTPEQRAVVQHEHGHARVSAVAGAGKTSTMVARVMHLLTHDVPAERIMVLMFNRQAREDFARKLKEVAQPGQKLPQVRTFHSVGHRLTDTLTRWGILPPATLLNAEWQWERLCRQAVQHVMHEEGDEDAIETALEEDSIALFGQFCDQVKGRLEAPEILVESDEFGEGCRHFPAAYHRLQAMMQDQRVMGYADLIHRPLKVLVKDKALRDRVSGFLDHVIVDEYQDINEAQNCLLAILAAGRAQVMAVGDANQCIYAWRGASVDAMKQSFERRFGAPVDYPLSYTFRHGHALALLANHAIAGSADPNSPQTLAAPGTPDTAIAAATGMTQALETLTRWREETDDNNIAVLVRSWHQSVALQLHLLRQGIPFRLGRSERFVFQLPLVRALAGYLEVARHPLLLGDADHLQLLFSQPPAFVARDVLRTLCQQLAQTGEWPSASAPVLSSLKPFQQRSLRQRWEVIQKLPQWRDARPAEALEHVTTTLGADKLLRRAAVRREKGEEDIRLLDVLIEQAGELAGDIDSFIALLKAPEGPQGEAGHGLLISTMHGAKGLEWSRVMLWGLNEEECPLYSRDTPLTKDSLDEERRLFYVGVTRARHALMLVNDGGQHRPSRFLEECAWQDAMAVRAALASTDETPPRVPVRHPAIVKRYLAAQQLTLDISAKPAPKKAAVVNTHSRKSAAHANTLTSGKGEAIIDPDAEWQVGDQLRHSRFGEGVVAHVRGSGAHCVIEVRFDHKRGITKLMASQAPISRL